MLKSELSPARAPLTIMKRVFIFSQRSLFSQGIQAMLDKHPALSVVGLESEMEPALQAIADVRPDAVLIIPAEKGSPARKIGQQLLEAGVSAVLMELDLKDNRVLIYRGELQQIEEVGGLARAIERFRLNEDCAPAPSLEPDV